MGAVAAAVATVGQAFMSGIMSQNQYEAQADAQRQQASIAAANAEVERQNEQRQNQQAEEQARIENDAAEVKHRQRLLAREASEANRGASGVAHSGSAAALYDESTFNMNMDRARDVYTGRQKVDAIFGQANDSANRASQYDYERRVAEANAKALSKAGKQSKYMTWFGGALQAGVTYGLAKANYSDKSSATKGTSNTPYNLGLSDSWRSNTGDKTWGTGGSYRNIGASKYKLSSYTGFGR